MHVTVPEKINFCASEATREQKSPIPCRALSDVSDGKLCIAEEGKTLLRQNEDMHGIDKQQHSESAMSLCGTMCVSMHMRFLGGGL